jgi:hypothetical protein
MRCHDYLWNATMVKKKLYKKIREKYMKQKKLSYFLFQ